MSRFAIIPARALDESRMTFTHLRILVQLGARADKNGWSFPGRKDLAAKAGNVSHSRVSQCVTDLKEWGFIQVEKRARSDGSQTSNFYRVLFDVGAAPDYAPADAEISGETGAFDDAPPVSHANPPVSSGANPPVSSGANPLKVPLEGTQKAKDKKRAPESEKNPQFETAWSAYPKRVGGNNKQMAQKAWNARITAGESAEAMIEGTRRYALFCERSGKMGTEYVKQAGTFFGPSRHYAESWDLPAEQAKSQGAPRQSSKPAKFDPLAYIGRNVPKGSEHGSADYIDV